MKCPSCDGEGKVLYPFSGKVECSWCKGSGVCDPYSVGKKPTKMWDSYSTTRVCCDKALELPRQCVCSFMTWCPDHGRRHIGTHD